MKRKVFKSSCQFQDLLGQGHDPNFLELSIHSDHWHLFEVWVAHRALIRCCRLIVGFDDFRPLSGLVHQLLLRQKVVGEDAVQFPDLVQQCQLFGIVIALISDRFTHPGSVFLFHVHTVVLVPGT